jgi:choice-of-anchor B domain-containing protein
MRPGPAAVLIALEVALAAPVQAEAIRCTDGLAGGHPCRNVDLMAFLPHSTWAGPDSGLRGNDIWGWVDPVTGHEWALVGTLRGTTFVDVTDPEAPVYAGLLPAPTSAAATLSHCDHGTSGVTIAHCANESAWRDLEVYADHAFIVSEQPDHGLVVFDLRQLRDVANPPVTFTPTARYLGFGNAHTVSINTRSGFAYVNGSRSAVACLPGATDTGGPVIVDIRTPASPTFAGCDLTDGYTHDAHCVTYSGPDAGHAGREICLNSNEDTLTIDDVTDKSSPATIARVTYEGAGYVHQGWLTPDHRYFVLDDERDETGFGHNTRTYVFDLLDLDAPVRTGTFTNSTPAIDHQQFVFGHYVYQSNYTAGLRILETAAIDSGTLGEVAFFDVFPAHDDPVYQGTWANYPFFESGTVVVNTIDPDGGLFVLRPALADLQVTVGRVRRRAVPREMAPSRVRFRVANAGPASGANARFSLTSRAAPLALKASQGTCDLASKTCALGTLRKGQAVTVDAVFPHRKRPLRYHASVQADEFDTRPLDNEVRGTAGPEPGRSIGSRSRR